jgi:serine/threonine protein kinase
MPSTSSCPDTEGLQRLATDLCSPQEALRLQRHVVRCPECARTLRTLREAAALLQSVAPEAGRGTRLPSGPGGGAAGESAIHGPASAREGGGPAAVLAGRGCFAPPQGPGELGRLGPYVIRKVLGAGGMGLVLEAEDPQLRRPVALKVMHAHLAADPAFRQRFLHEARAAAALDHEHIVSIYQASEEQGVLFLAMQLLRGETLDDRLRRTGVPPVAEVLRLGREIAAGLAAAHEHGLVHRDIKPANVWLEGSRGRVKILDFGLSRTVGDGAAPRTRTGAILGTPGYMAPEQARRSHEADARGDLFSLGAVLYHLCTGRPPFAGEDSVATLYALANHQPAAPHRVNPEVSPALSDLVMRLLAKDPAGRPATAAAVVEALASLERARAEVPPPLGLAGAATRPEKTSDRFAALLAERRARNGPEGRHDPGRLRKLVLLLTLAVLLGLLGAVAHHFAPGFLRQNDCPRPVMPPASSSE